MKETGHNHPNGPLHQCPMRVLCFRSASTTRWGAGHPISPSGGVRSRWAAETSGRLHRKVRHTPQRGAGSDGRRQRGEERAGLVRVWDRADGLEGGERETELDPSPFGVSLGLVDLAEQE